MRLSLLLPLAFIALCSASSCTKNYTCHCDIKYTGVPGLPDSTSKEFSIVDTKSGAKSKCTGQSGNYTNKDTYTDPIYTTETCYLY